MNKRLRTGEEDQIVCVFKIVKGIECGVCVWNGISATVVALDILVDIVHEHRHEHYKKIWREGATLAHAGGCWQKAGQKALFANLEAMLLIYGRNDCEVVWRES